MIYGINIIITLLFYLFTILFKSDMMNNIKIILEYIPIILIRYFIFLHHHVYFYYFCFDFNKTELDRRDFQLIALNLENSGINND